jgi:soluble lytic murein transglycosylase-like protein
VIQTGGARIRSTRNKSNENYPKPNQIMHPLLLSALIQVESGGNDHARGRHGEFGALQIKPIMVRDVNRIMGTHYTHAQVTNRAISIFIAESYFAHYGRNLSDESLARLWQGGPKALKRSSTRAYGRRVMRELQSMDKSNRIFTETHHFTVR